MLVGTNKTTTLKNILAIIRGKDGRGRTPLLQIKTVKGLERWNPPAFMMWDLPVIDHLKHMFSNAREAQLLLWHGQRMRDGRIRHPANGRQCKQFDLSHEDFSNDPRNIRFGLSTNGMNPFREMRNPHSTYPVIMCIYNLPPWLCHKRKYLLLTTLISSPKQADIDIDVFL
jgi:hypothetical protein